MLQSMAEPTKEILAGKMTDAVPCHGYPNSLLLNLPPLAMVVLKL